MEILISVKPTVSFPHLGPCPISCSPRQPPKWQGGRRGEAVGGEERGGEPALAAYRGKPVLRLFSFRMALGKAH